MQAILDECLCYNLFRKFNAFWAVSFVRYLNSTGFDLELFWSQLEYACNVFNRWLSLSYMAKAKTGIFLPIDIELS